MQFILIISGNQNQINKPLKDWILMMKTNGQLQSI